MRVQIDPGRVDGSRTAPYFQATRVKLLRQIVTLLIATAYIGATTLQAVPSCAAAGDMNHAAMGGMMHDQDNPADKMPCKGMLPGCVTDVGCIFFVTLPPPGLTVLTVTAWSSQCIARNERAHDQTRSRRAGRPRSGRTGTPCVRCISP